MNPHDPSFPSYFDEASTPWLSAAPSLTCPSFIDLASYIDDRVSERQRDAIDLHLAQCAACLAAVRDLRPAHGANEGTLDARDAAMVFVPLHVTEAAMALVSGSESKQADSPPSLRRTRPWLYFTGRGAAAAAAIALGMFGYRVGALMAPRTAEVAALDTFEQDISFGMVEFAADSTSEMELFAATFGEGSS